MREQTDLTQIANMSKMPAKKKSCFQITSVTQAQVAASSITDDTESLDDPDESRTEDVSSEIFDVSRTDLGVCDMSSSEETLNNVAETQEGQPPTTGPVNGAPSHKSSATGRVTPQNVGGSVPTSATHPLTHINTVPAVSTSVAPAAPVSASCSSRFRVIKLDHGSGEPFRRGRWTCTEFYERDSDSNVNRTVDSIRPTLTLDHSIDRDSGHGTTNNSVVTSSSFTVQPLENNVDSSSSLGQPAHLTHHHPSDLQQHGYSSAPPIGNGASAFQPTGYTSAASPQSQQAQVNMQPVAHQNVPSNGHNGVHQGAMQQKSPILSTAMQPQQFAFSTHPTGLAVGQLDYRQQHFGSSTQNLPITNLPLVPLTSQIASSLSNTAAMASIYLGSGLPVGQTQPSGGIVPSTTNIPQSVPSQAPGMGGLAQPLGGATTGLPSSFINQAEDSRQKSEAPPQPFAVVMPGKDGVKPFISEALNLPTPAVNSLFGIHITMDGNVDEDSASGASVVAIDNKIEQAMDLVKSHLMYAVREEVEVLKEQIKELYERNSMLERENAVLKSLANSEQLNQLSSQTSPSSSSSSSSTVPTLQNQPPLITNNNNNSPLVHHDSSQNVPHQPNISSA
uniref:TSC22 domain family protein 2 isoform X2 n=1 Tax=Solea senegalensis TaxID=28829 RepID=UPI001CD884A5|nr:TSC22 domain family protein 2 isoform X2 [Solea senegalensis]